MQSSNAGSRVSTVSRMTMLQGTDPLWPKPDHPRAASRGAAGIVGPAQPEAGNIAKHASKSAARFIGLLL